MRESYLEVGTGEAENRPSGVLTAISSAAFLLPGLIPQADAASAPDEKKVSYRYSHYEEDDLPRSLVFGGSTSRYKIDVHQIRFSTAIADDWGIVFDSQTETLTGASPWFSEIDSNGKVLNIMSSASIEEERTDIGVGFSHYREDGIVTTKLAISNENDYDAYSVGVEGEKELGNGLTTVSTGFSYSSDQIKPTQGRVVTNTRDEDKQTYSTYFSLGQVVNERTLVKFGFSWERSKGYLTDPYKWEDRRPDIRSRYTVTTGYRRFIDLTQAALHIDYRYYWDSWNVASHTLAVAWHQPVNDYLRLVPKVRLYTQQEADFFGVSLDDDAVFQATDYRLSTYGSLSVGLTAVVEIDRWTGTLHFEHYNSDNTYSLYHREQSSPGVVDFDRVTFGIDYIF